MKNKNSTSQYWISFYHALVYVEMSNLNFKNVFCRLLNDTRKKYYISRVPNESLFRHKLDCTHKKKKE